MTKQELFIIDNAKKEIQKIIDDIKDMYITDQKSFEQMEIEFNGHNFDEDEDDEWKLFDIDWDVNGILISTTIHLDEDGIRLEGSCDAYDINGKILIENYEW